MANKRCCAVWSIEQDIGVISDERADKLKGTVRSRDSHKSKTDRISHASSVESSG
jgi:hypothetical protein